MNTLALGLQCPSSVILFHNPIFPLALSVLEFISDVVCVYYVSASITIKALRRQDSALIIDASWCSTFVGCLEIQVPAFLVAECDQVTKFCLHSNSYPIGQNFVTWSHSATRKAGTCTCSQVNNYPLKLGDFITTK